MKKIYIVLMLIFISIPSLCLKATDYNQVFEDDYSAYQERKILENEEIEYYSKYILVDNTGKYNFNYSDDNDDVAKFINENIKLINELIDNDYAYINQDDKNDLIIESDELETLFGSGFKLYWYGLDFKIGRDGMIFFAVLGVLKMVGSSKIIDNVKNNINKNKLKSEMKDDQKIKRSLSKLVKDNSRELIPRIGYSSFRKIENCIGTIASVAGATAFAIAAATGGTWTVISIFLNYLLGQFFPSLFQLIELLLYGTGILFANICNVQVRWFRGWGIIFRY